MIDKLNKHQQRSSTSPTKSCDPIKEDEHQRDISAEKETSDCLTGHSLFKSRASTSNSLTSNCNSDCISNASSNSNNYIVSNDYAMSAAEQISAIINVVATQNLSPPLSDITVKSNVANQQDWVSLCEAGFSCILKKIYCILC